MGWWKTKKHILVREKRKIDEAFPDNNFSFNLIDDFLWISGTLLGFFEFECRYPPSYPSAPPDIFPKDRSSKYVPNHQYKRNGRFCLDIREKSWSSRLTAADIITSLAVLLIAQKVKEYTKSKELPVYEEPEPTILNKIAENKFGVFPSDIRLPSKISNGTFEYFIINKSHQANFVVAALTNDNEKKESLIAKIIWIEHQFQMKNAGYWFKIKSASAIKIMLTESLNNFFEILKESTEIPEGVEIEKYSKFIFFVEDTPSLFFSVSTIKDKSKVYIYGLYYLDMDKLMKRLPDQKDYISLKSKKVTIVGCGSGGSKDAEYLAKSGISNFVLIDGDYLKTENISRHACNLNDVGIEKPYALEDKLKKINPYAKIQTVTKRVDIISSDIDEKIVDSDLIIVATAENEELFNEYAFSHGIAAIYSKVYPMGFGGEVLRVLPGVTPCYECLHYFKETILQEQYTDAVFPDIETASYDTLLDGTHVPIPALAVDSDFITLIEVKMALEVLLSADIETLKDVPNIRLWGNQKEWIFQHDFECLSIFTETFRSISNCIVCHGEAILEQELNITTDQVESEYKRIADTITTLNDVK